MVKVKDYNTTTISSTDAASCFHFYGTSAITSGFIYLAYFSIVAPN